MSYIWVVTVRARLAALRSLAHLGLPVAPEHRLQAVGEVFQRGQRRGQGSLLIGGQDCYAFSDDRGSLRRYMLPGLLPCLW